MLKRTLITIHKILGLFLSLILLMWFISGFVMIYHSYPRLSQSEKLTRENVIPMALPVISSFSPVLDDCIPLKGLSLRMSLDVPVVTIQNESGISSWSSVGEKVPLPRPSNEIIKVVNQWNTADILKVDTLTGPDQWTLSMRLPQAPIYKFSFADEAKHQLYVASDSGDVLQYTSRIDRFWAWIGAIPHWVYFTKLRQDVSLWITSVQWMALVSCAMCLSGLWLGIILLYRSRKKQFASPYKKWWYRWHYISGLVFGVFVITFAFSGYMSLADIPSWLKKEPVKESARVVKEDNRMILLTDYKLDYRDALASIDSPKSIRWMKFLNHPYYQINTDNGSVLIDASVFDKPCNFSLSEALIHESMDSKGFLPNEYILTLLTEFDADYYSRKPDKAPLPVYRVEIKDELHTCYYFNPTNLSERKVDDNRRMRSFLYGGLHSLNIKILTDRPILWNIVMFTLMIGGTFLSLTGVVLSYRWLVRKCRKRIRQHKTQQIK